MEQTKPFDAVLKRLKKAQPAQRKLIKEMSKEWESMDKESIETSNVVLESTVKEEPNSYPSNSNEKKDESENCNSDQCESPDWSEFEGCFAKGKLKVFCQGYDLQDQLGVCNDKSHVIDIYLHVDVKISIHLFLKINICKNNLGTYSKLIAFNS